MRVYPEIESWNEFYPNEIFIRMGETETAMDAFPVYKIANIGTTIYLGLSTTETMVYKKIGKIEATSDIASGMILIGDVTVSKPGN